MSSELQFLDFFEEPVVQAEEEQVEEKTNVFDLLRAITLDKNLSSIRYNKSDLFFLIRFISHEAKLLQYAFEANLLYGHIDAEKIILFLEKRIPKGYYKVNYQKVNVEPNDVEMLVDYYHVSTRRATQYIELLLCAGKETFDEFMNDFRKGGKEKSARGRKKKGA